MDQKDKGGETATKKPSLLEIAEAPFLRVLGDFGVGDTVDVHLKIVEGGKERIQVFTGTVISMKGHGVNRSFTVRRLVGNEGVERVFPIHCPSIDHVEVKKKGRVRRAKLYYLRDRVGKATRIAEKLGVEVAGAAAEGPLPLEAAVKPRSAAPKPEEKESPAAAEKK